MAEIQSSGGGPAAKSTLRMHGPGFWPELGTDTNTKLRNLGFRVRARAGRFEVRKVTPGENGIGKLLTDGDGDTNAGWAAANRLAAL